MFPSVTFHCGESSDLQMKNVAAFNVSTCMKVLQFALCFLSYMWFVPKVSVLIFYINVYWTHLKLQVISFKV